MSYFLHFLFKPRSSLTLGGLSYSSPRYTYPVFGYVSSTRCFIEWWEFLDVQAWNYQQQKKRCQQQQQQKKKGCQLKVNRVRCLVGSHLPMDIQLELPAGGQSSPCTLLRGQRSCNSRPLPAIRLESPRSWWTSLVTCVKFMELTWINLFRVIQDEDG